jgi:hypothetical protein
MELLPGDRRVQWMGDCSQHLNPRTRSNNSSSLGCVYTVVVSGLTRRGNRLRQDALVRTCIQALTSGLGRLGSGRWRNLVRLPDCPI